VQRLEVPERAAQIAELDPRLRAAAPSLVVARVASKRGGRVLERSLGIANLEPRGRPVRQTSRVVRCQLQRPGVGVDGLRVFAPAEKRVALDANGLDGGFTFRSFLSLSRRAFAFVRALSLRLSRSRTAASTRSRTLARRSAWTATAAAAASASADAKSAASLASAWALARDAAAFASAAARAADADAASAAAAAGDDGGEAAVTFGVIIRRRAGADAGRDIAARDARHSSISSSTSLSSLSTSSSRVDIVVWLPSTVSHALMRTVGSGILGRNSPLNGRGAAKSAASPASASASASPRPAGAPSVVVKEGPAGRLALRSLALPRPYGSVIGPGRFR
jgi:hypothetical protein